MHPSGEFITYTTETARRLMRYDIRNERQMLTSPTTRPRLTDKRWFIAPHYLRDGRRTDATGLAVTTAGKMLQHIDLPGYGWYRWRPTSTSYALPPTCDRRRQRTISGTKRSCRWTSVSRRRSVRWRHRGVPGLRP